jgi:hypothetical protein
MVGLDHYLEMDESARLSVRQSQEDFSMLMGINATT